MNLKQTLLLLLKTAQPYIPFPASLAVWGLIQAIERFVPDSATLGTSTQAAPDSAHAFLADVFFELKGHYLPAKLHAIADFVERMIATYALDPIWDAIFPPPSVRTHAVNAAPLTEADLATLENAGNEAMWA